MQYRTVSFYDEFKCIGGACEDSCCDNWEIDLDDGSLKLYMSQKGEFGKRLKKCTRVKDKQFILNGVRCPFHNDDDLCDIFIEMGEEALCQTCTNFPRHIEEFDDLKEVSLTMSCPEASRIMLSKKDKMTFICKEGNDRDYGLKEIKAVSRFAFWKRGHENKLDKPLFDKLYEARELIYDMLQDRTKPVPLRAVRILSFAKELQDCVDEVGERQYGSSKAYSEIDDIIERYRGKASYDGKDKCIDRDDDKSIDDNGDKCIDNNKEDDYATDSEYHNTRVDNFVSQILNMYDGLENIKPEWKDILSLGKQHLKSESCRRDVTEFLENYKDKEYEFEHILVYYIFNYFLGASYDHDILTKVKFAVISYLVILQLDVARWISQNKNFLYDDQVTVAHAYSKEVEHSYNNYESLQLVLSAHPILTVDNIINRLKGGLL
ncbi:MAG: flagellin lysine-N-methylase [Lachnospiraceae bacterium]|nr:flagellin lysine-N-methylase [Lachnospiraceae bacterium]